MTQFKTLLTFILIFLSIQIFAGNFVVIKNKSSFDIYRNGKKLNKSSYQEVSQLPDNYFSVKQKNKYGIVNSEGVLIIENTFDNILYFSKDHFLVKKEDKWGLINHRNRQVLAPEYVGFKKYNDYLYKIKGKDGTGFINEQGVVLIPPIYEDLAPFSEHYFQVKKTGKTGIINELGEDIIPAAYDTIFKLSNSNLCIGKIDSRQEIINLSSRQIKAIEGDFSNVNTSFDEIDTSYGSFLILKKNSQIGFYVNNVCTPIVYDRIVFYQAKQGVIAVKQGNKYGLIFTKTGKVLESVYDNISRFNGGTAFAEKNGRLININVDGEEINL